MLCRFFPLNAAATEERNSQGRIFPTQNSQKTADALPPPPSSPYPWCERGKREVKMDPAQKSGLPRTTISPPQHTTPPPPPPYSRERNVKKKKTKRNKICCSVPRRRRTNPTHTYMNPLFRHTATPRMGGDRGYLHTEIKTVHPGEDGARYCTPAPSPPPPSPSPFHTKKRRRPTEKKYCTIGSKSFLFLLW